MHGANTMALADHDGDGDLDLFWGDFFEPGLLLIPNGGTCPAPNFRNPPAQFPVGSPMLTSGYNAPAFGDLSGTAEPISSSACSAGPTIRCARPPTTSTT